MGSEFADLVSLASVWILPVLIAITFHEAAHAYVAWRLGDDTAYMLGRVSFNPLKHVDPVGTVIVPTLLLLSPARILFGWAKPVPVNARRLRNPRRDMVLVALAGPGINLVLAVASAWLLRWTHLLPEDMQLWTERNLVNALTLNILLAVFNMLPLPPLDGGRVAVGLLPYRLAAPLARLERYGLFILVGLLLLLPMATRQLGLGFDPFGVLVQAPASWIFHGILVLVGLGP